jgi:hypothetical protein
MTTTIDDCEPNDNRRKMSLADFHYNWWMNFCSAILIGLLQLVLIRIGFLVYKKVKFNDKFMLTMIMCLNLDILGNLIFYSGNTMLYDVGKRGPCYNVPFLNVAIFAPVVMLMIAVIVNLRNW